MAVLEPEAVGDQASASSQIRTYLGFPHGVGGAELAHRAALQASQFGAEFVYGDSATGLRPSDGEHVVELASGGELKARSVVLAVGCTYGRLGIPALEELSGRGLFYGSAISESRAMRGREVFVLGGGNSAGQSAVDLAGHGARVTLLCREPSTRSCARADQARPPPAVCRLARRRTRRCQPALSDVLCDDVN